MPRQARKPCSGMGALGQHDVTEHGRIGPDGSRLAADPLDRPVGKAAVRRGHMLGHGGVAAVAAAAHVCRDPLAFVEQLDRARCDPRLDLVPGKAVRHRVEVPLDLDVIIEAGAPHPPFGEDVGLGRQGPQGWPFDGLEQLPPGLPEGAQDTSLVQVVEHVADGGVQFRQAVEDPMPQPAEEPALDDEHADFDLGFVARATRPGRQDGAVVMGRHGGVAAVDLGVVQARPDHRHLGIVGYEQRRRAAERLHRSHMRGDPIGQRLAPTRLGIAQARRSEDGHEEVSLADLAAQPVDHHRDRVACIVDEQFVAGRMALAHGHRQLRGPATVKIAETAVAVPVWMARDVLVPQDLQRDVLTHQLAMDGGPVGFRTPAVPRLRAGRLVQSGFQGRVTHRLVERPSQAGRLCPARRLTHRRGRRAHPDRDRLMTELVLVVVAQNLADTPHRHPLRWHPSLLRTRQREQA